MRPLLFHSGDEVRGQLNGESGSKKRDGPRVFAQLFAARSGADTMDRGLLILPSSV
jgi:hypothetical protein